MRTRNMFADRIKYNLEWFLRVMSCFSEQDARFAPGPHTFNVLGQVDHVMYTVELFTSVTYGAFDGNSPASRVSMSSFTNLDWLNVSNRQIGCEVELAGRIDEFTTSMHYLENVVADSTMMHLIEPLPHAELWKMFNTKQVSRMHLLEVCLDHNAHHRGALAQYARLLGKEPKLPYFDICDAVERIAAA